MFIIIVTLYNVLYTCISSTDPNADNAVIYPNYMHDYHAVVVHLSHSDN